MTRLTLPTAHIATLLRALTRDRDQLAAAGDDAEAQAVQAVLYAVEPQVVELRSVVKHEPVRVGDVWRPKSKHARIDLEVAKIAADGLVKLRLRSKSGGSYSYHPRMLVASYTLIERDGVPVAQEASHV
jgi:hypothetical protein